MLVHEIFHTDPDGQTCAHEPKRLDPTRPKKSTVDRADNVNQGFLCPEISMYVCHGATRNCA